MDHGAEEGEDHQEQHRGGEQVERHAEEAEDLFPLQHPRAAAERGAEIRQFANGEEQQALDSPEGQLNERQDESAGEQAAPVGSSFMTVHLSAALQVGA